MSTKINAAIDKIKQATTRIIGEDPRKYIYWQKIEPTGTVRLAWEQVGQLLMNILDEIQED